MDESLIDLPLMDRPIKVRALEDKTVISTCRLPDLNKVCLVVDEGVDTVLFFHFDSRINLWKAVFIKAPTSEEYLDKLFKMYPDLKGWIPLIPFGEKGDYINIRLMDGREFMTDNIIWRRRDDFSYVMKPYENFPEEIEVENIRYLHILYSQETFFTLEELKEDAKEYNSKAIDRCVDGVEMVFIMAKMHIDNYNKRQLEKQLKQQNENDTYKDRQ